MLAISVFICHLPSYLGLLSGTVAGSFLACLGSPAVGLFFFLSGYGLMTQFLKSGRVYLKSFCKRRILPFTIKYIIVLAFYVAVNITIGNLIESKMLIRSFLLGGDVLNGWYMQIQFWLYLAFFYIFRSKLDIRLKSHTMLLAIVAWYVFGVAAKLQGTYYISTVLFWLGHSYGRKNKKL